MSHEAATFHSLVMYFLSFLCVSSVSVGGVSATPDEPPLPSSSRDPGMAAYLADTWRGYEQAMRYRQEQMPPMRVDNDVIVFQVDTSKHFRFCYIEYFNMNIVSPGR